MIGIEKNTDNNLHEFYEKPMIVEIGNAEVLVLGGGEFLLDADNQTHLD